MSETKLLLQIEDEPFAIEWIQRVIKGITQVRWKFRVAHSEREFLLCLPEFEGLPIEGIILDIILPWEDGVINTTAQEYPKPRGEIFEAGIRVYRDIQSSRLRDVPLLVYSATEQSRIEWPPDLPRPKSISKQTRDWQLRRWVADNVAIQAKSR